MKLNDLPKVEILSNRLRTCKNLYDKLAAGNPATVRVYGTEGVEEQVVLDGPLETRLLKAILEDKMKFVLQELMKLGVDIE